MSKFLILVYTFNQNFSYDCYYKNQCFVDYKSKQINLKTSLWPCSKNKENKQCYFTPSQVCYCPEYILFKAIVCEIKCQKNKSTVATKKKTLCGRSDKTVLINMTSIPISGDNVVRPITYRLGETKNSH